MEDVNPYMNTKYTSTVPDNVPKLTCFKIEAEKTKILISTMYIPAPAKYSEADIRKLSANIRMLISLLILKLRHTVKPS